MSFFHNVWAFPIWRKLGRGCYVPSYVISYSKNELAYHKDSFMHILLIHVVHSLLYHCTLSHAMSRVSSIVSKSTIRALVHPFQVLGPATFGLLAPLTPLMRWSWFHIPKKMAKSQFPFWWSFSKPKVYQEDAYSNLQCS